MCYSWLRVILTIPKIPPGLPFLLLLFGDGAEAMFTTNLRLLKSGWEWIWIQMASEPDRKVCEGSCDVTRYAVYELNIVCIL